MPELAEKPVKTPLSLVDPGTANVFAKYEERITKLETTVRWLLHMKKNPNEPFPG